ncbi:MAG TPA: prephenate dehydrogenase/arogenate dehydrogenase family protein [Candidatus Limnocylindrales bacterium]|nr:prephenate dehydrogenase/arogenate dehydrogenase family protein [Candidatus Limnocylindrales bacterium]
MDLALLGLGQIGGSIARAALASGVASRVVAWTPNGRGPAAAEAHGIASTASAAEAVAAGDLIVLAAPPLACLALLGELAGPLRESLRPDAVITDVASTKAAIVERARELGLRFVGGHPMAGREASGYEAADPELARGRPWVVVPADPADSAAAALVERLAVGCGARPIRMTAAEHDAATALISHAPLVVSAALVEAAAGRPEWPAADSIRAGGWAGMTRLARGDPAMGAGILATNAGPTAAALRAFRDALDDWIDVLDGAPSGETLAHRLERARARAGDGES